MEPRKSRTLNVLALSGCLLSTLAGTTSVRAQSSAGNEGALARLSGSFESLSEQVGPAVVQIFATGYSTALGNTESSLLSRDQSSGSGVILDPEGYILTNAHVVSPMPTWSRVPDVSRFCWPDRCGIHLKECPFSNLEEKWWKPRSWESIMRPIWPC